MFVQFISPGQFVAPFSLRLYVQDVGRADAFDKCALPKTNGYDNSTIRRRTMAKYLTHLGICGRRPVGDHYHYPGAQHPTQIHVFAAC